MLSTVEKVLFLKKVDLFRQVPGEELTRIARIAREVSFDTDEVVINEGEIGDSLYLIIEGGVRVHIGDQDISYLEESKCFGEIAILDAAPRTASITAIKPVKALRISREEFTDLLHERNEIAIGVIKILTLRLRGELDKMHN